MIFKDLYSQSKAEIEEAIIGYWKEIAPEMVEKYGSQLNEILASSFGENIVVENMAHWTSLKEGINWKKIINPSIWRRWKKGITDEQKIRRYVEQNTEEIPFQPYQHQYDSWHALLKEEKSIVVTSGTGSGKTECFMVPLVYDLTKNQDKNCTRTEGVEAIFLYPLNALMEDQKERINNYITFSGKDLKFAVYNGNTPENETDDRYDTKGIFENEIVTREKIRSQKPNILFTNPSMLEYMLLRSKDKPLFSTKLKWIVIDETHIYKGAAAAELAMLLRRVLKACGKKVNEIKFATSSATIGDGKEAEKELLQFISDITGQDKDHIKRIAGSRSLPATKNNEIQDKLKQNDFILLKDLINDSSNIEEKLDLLDNLSDKSNGHNLRIRLHYYLQTLNGGLYIDLRKLQDDNSFKLFKSIPLIDGKLDTHFLEAYYCKKCGSLVGHGELLEDSIISDYSLKTREIVDSLEGDDDDENNNGNQTNANKHQNTKEFYIGIAGEASCPKCSLNDDGKLNVAKVGKFALKQIELKDGKQIHWCPCCGSHGSDKYNPLRSFHMSADFISRLIAPILLNQTTPAQKDQNKLPSNGCKYITFADSRQGSAGPTLKQNLETEEVWVAGVIFNELIKRKEENAGYDRYQKLLFQPSKTVEEVDELRELHNKYQNWNNNTPLHLTWEDTLDLLLADKNFDQMHLAFVSSGTQMYMLDKYKYAVAALYRVMNRRPSGGYNSPENCGLFCTTYPSLAELKERDLPQTIVDLNNIIPNEGNKIRKEDWFDFVKLFIDLKIRTDGSFFFDRRSKSDDWNKIDFKDCRGFKTEHYSRRPIDGEENPIFGENTRYTQLLINLLGKKHWRDLDENEKEIIKGVAEKQLKADLEKCGISENSESIDWEWDRQNKIYTHKGWKKDKDDNKQHIYYMNLTKIAFKLYNEEVWFDKNLCIPLDTTFKGYSPYKDEESRYIKCNKIKWPTFNKEDKRNCKEWFMTHREHISKKWTSKLGRALQYSSEDPNTLYIQAEHTAQVARSIIKDKTQKFKNGEINIMACSTTMEMGVDLGDLELVVMNNVPPHPANYKQRAGRAGRGDQMRSACFTICGTDATGDAMMKEPLKSLINYPIQPPKVDMRSTQLIQRHINSFLLRTYIEEEKINFAPGIDTQNDKGAQVCHMFTNYTTHLAQENNIFITRVKERNGNDITPGQYKSLLDQKDTLYQKFLEKLENYKSKDDYKELRNCIKELATSSSNSNPNEIELIINTQKQIKAVAEYIDKQLEDIKKQWIDKNCKLNDKLGKSLNYSFTGLLKKNLLGYLSTHQFTPNANMPVGIVEMLIKESDDYGRSENPTRDMRVALSEYAPGRMVFVNGTTYVMGGVDWNKTQPMEYARHCSNHHVWIGQDEKCPICGNDAVEWEQPFGTRMPILTPTGFRPCKETSRITKKNYEDLVISTELINAKDWEDNNGENRLYAVRVNEDGPGSEILYYNKGLGNGYYVCKECGYAVPVPLSTGGQEESEIIKNNIYHEEEILKNGDCTLYHNYRWKCNYDNTQNFDKILKNVVFGGKIQTDFSEIALLSKFGNAILDVEIAKTLGLMLCKELSRKIGCERSDIDFIVRQQNGQRSVCIYDTAKGGAGYSNRLGNLDLLENLFDIIREQLDGCTSVEKVLDRMTMKYANEIDIKKTYEWLKEEFEYRKPVDDIIQNKFTNNVTASSYGKICKAISVLNEDCKLFFNGRLIKKWNYNNGELNWQENRSYDLGSSRHKIYTMYDLPGTISSCDKEKMQLTSAGKKWKRAQFNIEGIYPLAMIKDKLYFTTDRESSTINEKWGLNNVYCVDYNTIEISDLCVNIISDKHYTYEKEKELMSDELFEELYNNIEEVRTFINSAKNSTLSFRYHEEYLRTHLNMAIALQFMLKFAEKANATIKNITCIGEEYEDRFIEARYPKNYDYRTGDPTKLFASIQNNRRRDEYLETKFLQPLKDSGVIKNFDIQSLEENSLPHWRALIAENGNGDIINILPNGGFGNGWFFDNDNATRAYFPNNCDVTTPIPIKSGNNGILYDIKVGEL